MHRSTYLRMEYLMKYYEPYLLEDGKQTIRVLDIGSYDVNGTYRDLFCGEIYEYTGMDMQKGPNVDIVPADIYHWNEIEDESFDLVISGQVFEHIEFPWLTIKEIDRILKPSGFCMIIAPNAGMEHKAPLDCFRFFSDGLAALAKWAGFFIHHLSVAGIPAPDAAEEWNSVWNDSCLVAQKNPAAKKQIPDPFLFERRAVPLKEEYVNTYKTWELAVAKACETFDGEKPIAIYGAGTMGEVVLDILGEEKVSCFIDSSPDKAGKPYLGKPVISPEEFLHMKNDYHCLVAAMEPAASEIREKLKKRSVSCATLYPEQKP